MSDYGICTIFAKNYLAAARVLAESFLTHHPDAKVFGLLCDRLEGFFDPATERFSLVSLEDLGIPELGEMIYKYNITEMSTAVKPALLSYLFSNTALRKLCYFDPDILILRPLDQIFDLLDSNNIVLTPHLVEPQTRDWAPSERQLLLVGAYNLGFIGLRKTSTTAHFLNWWHGKLIDQCFSDPYNGLFVDQRWVDLVPSLFDGVHIHRDPGCNVAYWNLPERMPAREQDGGYSCCGRPITFFHFSGYSPRNPQVISRHQEGRGRFLQVDDLGPAAKLFETYRQLLIQHGYETTSKWPYALSSFTNGIKVPDLARRLFEQARQAGVDLTNPLDSENPAGFYQWLLHPIDDRLPVINRLAQEIYKNRPDVRKAFPDLSGADRRAFVYWYITTAIKEYALSEVFISDMRESLNKSVPVLSKVGLTRVQPAVAWLRSHPLGRKLLQAGLLERARRWALGREDHHLRSPLPEQKPNQLRPSQVSAGVIAQKQRTAPQHGLNVLGYLSAETGVGEVPRGIIRALSAQNYPLAITHLDNTDGARREDRSVLDLPQGVPYAINLFAINADGWNHLRPALSPEITQGKINIACWFWEISRFPEHLLCAFEGLDEVWVASSFTHATLSEVSPVPVVKIGAPIVLRDPAPLTRRDLGLPEDRAIFLYAFDMLSVPERKNPLAVVEAYRLAFDPHFSDTHLVLKANHLHRFPEWRARLQQAVASVHGTLIEDTLDRSHVNALFQQADVYVSLHRSEGFGLTIAEAMRMGKPVIATDYGGPHDFLTQYNSYPVRYSLVELDQDHGPYKAGNVWADPDIEHAATLMLQVLNDSRERHRRATQAALDIEKWYGASSIAQRIICRLDVLLKKANP